MMLTDLVSRLSRVAIGICFIPMAQNALALCSNGRHLSVTDELASSTMVLVAKVTSSHDESSPDDPEGVDKTIYRLNVVRAFKGAGAKELSITSENTSGRFPMDVGKSYLLFVKSYGNLNIVDPCGNSGLLAGRTGEVDILNNAISPHGKQ